MQIVRDLGGYSLGRSDLMRRAMSKKKHDVMAKEREYFVYGMKDEAGNQLIPGCINNGISEDVANHIFDEMTSFASYAFNKSHAAAYAVVAVQTGWLKLHYPVEFMAAIMNSVFGNSAKIALYIQYCRAHSINILPPDVNASTWRFRVDVDSATGNRGIRFGFGAVKNLGHAAAESIVSIRKTKMFTSIFDFLNRADTENVNKRGVESLIRAGAFDSLGAYRSQLLAVYEKALDGAASRRKHNVAGQVSLFDMGGPVKLETPIEQTLPDEPEYSRKTLLSMEKEMTGVYITGHPLDEYAKVLSDLECDTAFVMELSEREDRGLEFDGMQVTMGGILVDARGKATKKGDMMGFITLEDLTGQIEGLVFPKIYERFMGELTTDALVVLSGKLSVREDESPKLLVDSVVPLTKDSLNLSQLHQLKPTFARKEKSPPASTPVPLAENRKVYLRCSREAMERVTTMLADYPGTVPVYIHIPAENKTLMAPQDLWCDSCSLLQDNLVALLGPENVRVVSKP